MNTAELPEAQGDDLPENVFALPPPAFIEAWSKALGLGERDLSDVDREHLARAIRHGTSRMKVIDAMDRHRAGAAQGLRTPRGHGLRREPDGFALLEVYARFAPDDDAAFLRYAFAKICDRSPSERERLEFEFDLRRCRTDRATIVKKIVAIAGSEGRMAFWDSLEPGADLDVEASQDRHSARTMPAGLSYDEGGRETLIFVREVQGAGLIVAPDILRQHPKTVDGGWAVTEGWLVVGPKRTFAPGSWRVDLDIVQSDDSVVDVDVVANSGLDVLQSLAVCRALLRRFPHRGPPGTSLYRTPARRARCRKRIQLDPSPQHLHATDRMMASRAAEPEFDQALMEVAPASRSLALARRLFHAPTRPEPVGQIVARADQARDQRDWASAASHYAAGFGGKRGHRPERAAGPRAEGTRGVCGGRGRLPALPDGQAGRCRSQPAARSPVQPPGRSCGSLRMVHGRAAARANER